LVKNYCKEYDIIIAVGGDGTVNEVVNGMLSCNNQKTFGVLPVGSGNDFVKNLNLPKNIEDILSVYHNDNLSEVIKSDIGVINFKEYENDTDKVHYFINGLGIGFDAYVAYLNQQNKTLSGLTSYILAVFKALLNYKMLDVNVEGNNFKITGKKLMLTIGNGISSGGGFYLTPNAVINDSILNFSIFEAISRRRLLTALPLVLLNKIDKIPEATMYEFKELSIRLLEPYYVHCDGEIITDKMLSADIKLADRNLDVINSNSN
jgi:YegS/Rv2252/BmrU family lipid kinase